ncbi:hypothetical protein C8R44DRAFT_751436 [Mycena epipterygia]|nr:hypothetical protein C8R44DRAFT_751436 [Mycena epipterygia]
MVILVHAFGCFVTNPKAYAKNRESIRHISKCWKSKVDGYPRAWSAVYVSLRHVVPDVIAAIAKVQSSPLSIYVELTDLSAVGICEMTPANIGQFAANILDVLITVLDRTHDLDIHSMLHPATRVILAQLPNLCSSSLSTLRMDLLFAHLIPPESYRSTTDPHSSNSAYLLPSLTDIQYRSTMTWPAFRDMMMALLSLKVLRLKYIEMSDVPNNGELLPVIPSLDELHLDVIDYTVDTAFALLQRLRLPRLQKLHLGADSSSEFDTLAVADASFLEDISYLAIRAPISQWEVLRRVLIKCDRVTSLDLQMNGGCIFDSLTALAVSSTPTGGGTVCENLKKIIVHQQLMDILVWRNPRIFGKGLVIRMRVHDVSDEDELEWYDRDSKVYWRHAKRASGKSLGRKINCATTPMPSKPNNVQMSASSKLMPDAVLLAGLQHVIHHDGCTTEHQYFRSLSKEWVKLVYGAPEQAGFLKYTKAKSTGVRQNN